MQDVEIESLLEDAGYRFDAPTNQYVALASEDEAYTTETIADQLEIPLDDLQRWEAEQQQADEVG